MSEIERNKLFRERHIDFNEERHEYTVDGEKLPSVSTILGKTFFANKYANVSEHILKRAAEFGTNVHKAVETEMTFMLSDEELEVYEKYLLLKQIDKIKPIRHEIMVHLDLLYTGTFDIIATIRGKRSLCDVKTTYQLDLDYISWQLSLYELANGEFFESLYAIWIPKRGAPQVKKVKRRTQKELEDVLSFYYGRNIDLTPYYETMIDNRKE